MTRSLAVVILAGLALVQLILLSFRTSLGHVIFQLAVVDTHGRLASRARLARRWAIVWIPLALPVFAAVGIGPSSYVPAAGLLLVWLGLAVHTALRPHRGWPDRLASTWVVRR